MSIKEISRNKCFGGHVIKYEHHSDELDCDMKFNVFLPLESSTQKVPAIYFLSGLTCTEDNFIQKSGAMAEAAKHGIALIAPDTSPRGVKIEGDDDSWDFGTGAGFYIDATQPKWSKNYRMYSYITKELYQLVYEQLPIDENRISIMGHSMGGHGALTIFIKNPSKFKSVSAFAPIANPMNCPWGQKAFSNYLGSDKESWKQYDTIELLKTHMNERMNALVDVGTADGFLEKELLIDELNKTVKELGRESEWKIRYQDGYDHSYFFISTFIADHIQHHATYLKA
ncbi:s-formylglutathione hydrolase-like protein [Cokeromyces recurvatus]|uniref:s-formylglutathione hydrolase-like protein n=1 Tax=Cokeromyces recurvatus TaxID=90255 RepID=UPI00221E97AA|nr:s-formylglutathione hydrolase-like protein [Cokeromyces recurvatus]KAI7907727.1 s-formylglutathione hydrolase-like protein [Cokeromyces recurvatus]